MGVRQQRGGGWRQGAPNRSRRARLSRSADFERVYRRGSSRASRYLVVYSFPREHAAPSPSSGGGPRLGISVGRKVGGAVERNRVKRALREAFGALSAELPADHDFVLVARPDAGALVREDGEPGVESALRELVTQVEADRAAG